MSQVPSYLQDAEQLLSSEGFKSHDIWYHGTSSALIESIIDKGLNRSGDTTLNDATKATMATIGNQYQQSCEPVFLTQSKELAYYWAQQTVRERGVRFEGEDQPVVLAVKLDQSQQSKIKPDVGATSLLLMESGERFMVHLASIYERCGFQAPDIDLMKANRMEFLNKLGMAYIDQDIKADSVKVISE